MLHSPLSLCLVQVGAGSREQWDIQDPETFLGDGRCLGEEEACGQGELVSFSSLRLSLSYRWRVRLLEIELVRALQLYPECLLDGFGLRKDSMLTVSCPIPGTWPSCVQEVGGSVVDSWC